MASKKNRKPIEIPSISQLPDNAVLRLPVVLALTGMSRSGWYYGMEHGYFPRPVRIGLRAVGWRVADICKLLADAHPITEADPNVAKAVAAKAARRTELL